MCVSEPQAAVVSKENIIEGKKPTCQRSLFQSKNTVPL